MKKNDQIFEEVDQWLVKLINPDMRMLINNSEFMEAVKAFAIKIKKSQAVFKGTGTRSKNVNVMVRMLTRNYADRFRKIGRIYISGLVKNNLRTIYRAIGLEEYPIIKEKNECPMN